MSLDGVMRKIMAVRLEMIREGWPLIPITPDEVAALETTIDEAAVVLPPSLLDPEKVLRQ